MATATASLTQSSSVGCARPSVNARSPTFKSQVYRFVNSSGRRARPSPTQASCGTKWAYRRVPFGQCGGFVFGGTDVLPGIFEVDELIREMQVLALLKHSQSRGSTACRVLQVAHVWNVLLASSQDTNT
jgi:hypothetical protein